MNSLNDKKCKIIFKEKECLIQIKNPITNKTFDLPINIKEKDTNSRIKDLEEIISQQNNKISFLEEKIKQFEPMFEEYLNKKKEEEIMKESFKESQILNKVEKKLLVGWLFNKPKKIILLMNSKIDGHTTKVFKINVEERSQLMQQLKLKKVINLADITLNFGMD